MTTNARAPSECQSAGFDRRLLAAVAELRTTSTGWPSPETLGPEPPSPSLTRLQPAARAKREHMPKRPAAERLRPMLPVERTGERSAGVSARRAALTDGGPAHGTDVTARSTSQPRWRSRSVIP